MKARCVAVVVIVSMLVAPFATAAMQTPTASSLSCVAPGINPRVTTNLPAGLRSPRVYFRATNTASEYYVDMQQGTGDLWWAIIPGVEASTRSITYRVAALDANNNWISGASVIVGTTATCPLNPMAPADKVAADNIVLGLTRSDQPAVPVGFSCHGVKSIITEDGHMRPAQECRAALAAAATGAGGGGTTAASSTTVTSSGLSRGTIVAIAVGGAVAGYAIYHNNKNNKSTSPSRP